MPYLGTAMVNIKVAITTAQKRGLDKMCKETGDSFPWAVRWAIQIYLNSYLMSKENPNEKTYEVVSDVVSGMDHGNDTSGADH